MLQKFFSFILAAALAVAVAAAEPSIPWRNVTGKPSPYGFSPRQALVCDGSAGASLANVSAFGTADFTLAVWVLLPSIAGEQPFLWGGAGSVMFECSSGALQVAKRGGSWISGSTTLIPPGKWTLVGYTRTGGTGTYYVNGVAAGTQPDVLDYTVAPSIIAGNLFGAFVGSLVPPLIEIRALSAAEMLALYENGTPAAADYAASSALPGTVVVANTAALSTLGGGASFGGGTITMPNSSFAAVTGVLTLGKRYRVTLTVAGAGNGVYFTDLNTANYGSVGLGTSSFEFVATATDGTNGQNFALQNISGAGQVTITNLSVVAIGLLCAPEFNAPGNGYQWHDASGTMSDITLPATGVRWALPDGRPNYVRGTLTWSGTHEPKSLGGTRLFPAGAVLTLGTRSATASSSGTGCILGTTNSGVRWQAADTFTTAKETIVVANALPAGTADADNDVIVDPDNANFTGSITVQLNYVITP